MDKTLKIYLDDVRVTPNGYTRCYWPEEVIELLKTGTVAEISLDHDLGFQGDKERSGYEVLLWIEEQVAINRFDPPEMHIHSDNASGIDKMRRAIQQIWTLADRNVG